MLSRKTTKIKVDVIHANSHLIIDERLKVIGLMTSDRLHDFKYIYSLLIYQKLLEQFITFII